MMLMHRPRSPRRLTAKSTALEVIQGYDLTGCEAIVTGGSSGIGIETVRALATAGARVVIGARDIDRANLVAGRLRRETGSAKIETDKLDLASLKSVHEFSLLYLAKNRPLHLLINNAGVMACPQLYTEDDFELQIGTNHLGHFALTLNLLPALRFAAKTSRLNARVINLSSIAHIYSPVNFEDINYRKTAYDPWKAYGQSKTANVLFSVALNRNFSPEGINSFAVMPGIVPGALQRYMADEDKVRLGFLTADGRPNFNDPRFKTPEQGAATTIWACLAPELENRGGLYLEDCSIAPVRDPSLLFNNLMKGNVLGGVAPYALDHHAAERLWTLSEQEIYLKYRPINQLPFQLNPPRQQQQPAY